MVNVATVISMARFARFDYDLGYLTAAIDGEGTIFLIRHKAHDKRRAKTYNYVSYEPMLAIVNTSRAFIEKCASVLEPIKCPITLRPGTSRWKPLYSLRITRKEDLETILWIVGPRLTIKGPQAGLVLDWIRLDKKRSRAYPGHPAQRFPEEEKIHAEIKRLNQRRTRLS